MFTLIDSHSHLDDDSFLSDRKEILARAQSVGVTQQIVPATHAKTWPRLRKVCQQHSGLHPAYGLHPMYLHEHQKIHLEQLGAWVEQEKPVAIGECGLDYYVKHLDRHLQEQFFAAQLDVAQHAHLPVIIHARHSVDDVIKLIRRVPGTRGVVHSFSGSIQQTKQLLLNLVLEMIQIKYGGKIRKSKGKQREYFTYYLHWDSIESILNLLKQVLPYLICKKPQAELMFSYVENKIGKHQIRLSKNDFIPSS